MAQKEDLFVGQPIYLSCLNSSPKRIEANGFCITKIGNKYLTLENRLVLNIDTMEEKTEFSSGYKGYVSKQEFEDEMQQQRLYNKIRNYCFYAHSNTDLTITQLQGIAKIIGIL